LRYEAHDVGFVTNICRDGQTPYFTRHRCGAFPIEVGDDYASRALSRKAATERSPNPIRTAGDNNNPVLDSHA
jgi:hypothetical protein